MITQNQNQNQHWERKWQETFRSSSSHKEFDKMWQLAPKAPPIWSRKFLQELGKVGWSPSSKEENKAFQVLLSISSNCVKEIHKLGGLLSSKKQLIIPRYESPGSVTISPDGRILASARGREGWKGIVRLWQLPDYQNLGTLAGDPYPIRRLVVSSNGKTLTSEHVRNGTVSLSFWQLPDGRHLGTLKGNPNGLDEKTLLHSTWSYEELWVLELPCVMTTPPKLLTPEDIKWVADKLQDKNITEDERHWLEFVLELIRWERRFDIEIEVNDEIPGELDIKID